MYMSVLTYEEFINENKLTDMFSLIYTKVKEAFNITKEKFQDIYNVIVDHKNEIKKTFTKDDIKKLKVKVSKKNYNVVVKGLSLPAQNLILKMNNSLGAIRENVNEEIDMTKLKSKTEDVFIILLTCILPIVFGIGALISAFK